MFLTNVQRLKKNLEKEWRYYKKSSKNKKKLFLKHRILIFLLVYTPLFWRFSMNEYERALLLGPIKKVINKK